MKSSTKDKFKQQINYYNNNRGYLNGQRHSDLYKQANEFLKANKQKVIEDDQGLPKETTECGN